MALVRVYCGLASAELGEPQPGADIWLTVAVVDDAGRLLDICEVSDDAGGYAELSALLAQRSGNQSVVAVAADSDDHVVTQLLTASGRNLAYTDEDSADDYAERFADDESPEEIQSNTAERRAVGLARALQAGVLSAVGQSPPRDMIALKPVLAAHGAIVAGRQHAAATLREILRELYPAALRAYPDPAEPIPLAVLDALPEPGSLGMGTGGRSRDSQVVAELTASGVADSATIAEAITALRVAIAETPRRSGVTKSLTAAVAETIRQSVASVRASDAAAAALVGILADRMSKSSARAGRGTPRATTLTAVPSPADIAPPPPPIAPLRPVPVSSSPMPPPRRKTPAQPAPAAASFPLPPLPPPTALPQQPAAYATQYPSPQPIVPQPVSPGSYRPASSPTSPPPPPGIAPLPPAPAARQRTTYVPREPRSYEAASFAAPSLDSTGSFPQPSFDSGGYNSGGFNSATRPASAPAAYNPPPARPTSAPSYGSPSRPTSAPSYNVPASSPPAAAVSIPFPLPPRMNQPAPSDYGTPSPHVAPPLTRSEWPLVGEPSDVAAYAPVNAYRDDPLATVDPLRSESLSSDVLAGDPLTGELPRVADLPRQREGRVPPPWQDDDLPLEPPSLRLVEPAPLSDPALSGERPYDDELSSEYSFGPPALRLVNTGYGTSNSRRGDRAEPPVGAESDGDLLIFAAARSAWFTDQVDDKTELTWTGMADAGWQAAQRATDPLVGPDHNGLPRRVPQQNLVPGSAAAPERPLRIVRDPAAIAAHTTGYFRGWRRGQEAGGYSVGGRPGRESAGGWDFARENPNGGDYSEPLEFEYRSAHR